MDDVKEEDCEDAGGGDGEGKMPVIHNWYLVDPCQKKLRLPRTMLFLGRDECDIIIQSGTVDKRHAVITFDLYLSRFKVKDLSTTNGTYVNESRIPEQEYVTLNHMDTIRLGYDSKVYHMEQGEPCGGDSPPSPSPPLSLQQSPPPPPIHVSGGGSTCTTTTKGPVDTTGWSSHHKDSSPMAECQGCIAEQRIEHTCTHTTLSHHHHHHHPCPIQDPDHHPQFVDVQRKNTDTEDPGQEPEYQTVSPPLDPTETEAPPEQKIRQARNTWPRKKVRQTRRAVAADLFAAADDDDGGVGEDVGDEILVENGSNYFVSVDDSALGESGRGRVVVEYSLSRTGSVHRIPRNSKHPLPPELETVKKGTPLYGQPSWWGEDTDTGDKDAMEPQQKPEAKSPRPSSLVVQGDGSLPQHQDQHPKGSKPVYMEIPHRAASPERDKPQRDKTTPARSLTSSLSKDSLVLSPDSARERSVDKDSDPGKGTSGGCAGEAPNSNPALSFTVEFGDERKKARLKSGASLSQFVPMKLRNSLSSHARTEKAPSRGRDSDGSCKNSEERELSPIASVKPRRPSEEPCGGSETPSKGKSARRSSGQGTGVGSLKSSDFGTDTTPVSTKSRKDGEKKTREAEKEVDKKPPKPQEPRKSSARTPTTKGSKTKPQPSAAAIAASVQAAQYSDPTAYLIDRMFAGATESPRSTSSDLERSESPAAPEHVMYKEAREYDRATQRGSGTYRASGSKPAQKQKSLSKSPASSSKSPVVTSTSTPKSPVAVASPRTAASKTVGSKAPEKPSRQLKEKSAEPERPLVAAAPAPQALPKAPSPIAGGGGDQEDKVSEAGTYTIEVEEDGEEELMARQQIDEVFGVDVNSFNFERPVIGTGKPLRSSEGEEEEGEEKTLHEDEGESTEPGCHTPCDVEGENVFDEDEDEVEDEEGLMSRSMGEEEVPSWVSQLNSLTSGIRHSSTGPEEAARKEVVAKGTEDASKKPPQGLSRKRPGTGRKLPSIPSANDQSPVSSEHSSHLQHSPNSPANATGHARLENGHDRSIDDSPSRNVKFSPVVSSTGALSGKAGAEASPCGSEDSGTNNVNSGAIPKGSSSMCSRGSIDTELLLRDTETVMAAMEARMGFRRDKGEEEEDAESDTDLTSTRAMVNGDEDFVKPTKYNSPRDKMTGKVSKDKDNSNIRIASVSSSRKSLSRSLSEQKPPLKSPRSAVGVSVVSDVFSRSDSLDQSFQSDVSDGGSSDRTETTFSRSGSRGKGTITMTKPNRAFALRRARADGSEVTDTARSRTSAASTAAAASSRRSSSIHGTPRTSYSDRTGTEASLGAQIAKKARDNTAASKARESSVTRGDRPPRDSLRATDRRSSASSSASSTISSAKKERDIRTLKSQLKSTPGNKDLAITGVSSSRSQSQPGSRSNSPKAAERMAWKRRKEYDPRKAVAEAKAKAKEPRPKPKVQSSSLYKQRMTRSASFTSSVELSGRVRHDTYNVDSISSVEDLSSAATAVSDPYRETGFRRAFIPFHNPLRSDRLSHSADEDEAGPFPSSQEPSNRAKPPAHPVSLMLHKSAFTPPLSKLQTPSPDSPSPQSSLLLRRRTLGAADFDEAGASTAASSHRTQADSFGTQSSSPQSYDSLIVSSIYQLSLKLKTTMDKALMKLREQDRASITPSPIDDFLGHPTKSEIPAWKSANQELAGVLKNLRKMEHHLHLMERALFPDEDTDTEVSGMSSSEKHKYFQEIERIRSELAGFQPIDAPQPQSQDPGSPEMAELSKNIH